MSLHVLTDIHYTKKSLSGGLRAALFYGHRDVSLESSLTPCPFRKIVVVSPLEPMSSAAMGSWGRFTVRLKYNPKVVT